MACNILLSLSSQGLITTSSDVVGQDFSVVSPMMIQAAADQFYWIGGCSSGDNLDHPTLNNNSDFDNLLIARYEKGGKIIYNKLISGSREIRGAYSLNGDLCILGRYATEVFADGLSLPATQAPREEFLIKYADGGLAENLVAIWENGANAYPTSSLAMDSRSGDFYVYGRTSMDFVVKNFGIIGEEWENYIYVIHYDHDLNFLGVRTFGFTAEGEYGSYRMPLLNVDVRGDLYLTGLWEGDFLPIMEGDTLNGTGDYSTPGIYVLKLDRELNKIWVMDGSLQGEDWDYGAGFEEGLALADGDMVFTGRTPTGFFVLGDELSLEWDKGMGSINQFAFRMNPEGKIVWEKKLYTMEDYYIGKGTESDHYGEYFNQDAINWRDKTLYMAGTFRNDEFMFAGEILTKELYEGAFVAAIDMENGDELWAYGLSSNEFDLNGFDMDRSGNVCLLGRSGANQVFQPVEVDSVPGSRPLFLLGLDHSGEPLWRNNGFIGGKTWGYSATDLEVLDDGTLFATLYKTQPEDFEIGGAVLNTGSTNTLMLVSLHAANNVGGMISNEGGEAIVGARIRAIKSTRSGTRPVVDSVLAADAGLYSFKGLYPGNYIFQVVPDPDLHENGMTTYSGGAISWDQARIIPIKAGTDADFLDIILSELAPLTPGDGSGKASGNVSYADAEPDVVIKGTMGRPAKKTTVLLLKKSSTKGTMEGDVVAYVETDDLGNYVFENVPDGEYLLIVDIPGLPMVETYDVVIEGNVIVSGLDFTVDDEGVNTSGTTGIQSRTLPEVSLYPNPGNGLLYMQISQAGDYKVEVFDTFGKLHSNTVLNGVSGLVEMDITFLDEGLYLIKIQGSTGGTTLKYLKQ